MKTVEVGIVLAVAEGAELGNREQAVHRTSGSGRQLDAAAVGVGAYNNSMARIFSPHPFGDRTQVELAEADDDGIAGRLVDALAGRPTFGHANLESTRFVGTSNPIMGIQLLAALHAMLGLLLVGMQVLQVHQFAVLVIHRHQQRFGTVTEAPQA